MKNNTTSYNAIDLAYWDLYAAYQRRDRNAMITCCAKCQNIGVPQFHERANKEVEKIYSMMELKPIN